jgi:TRAP-type transport system periplasmic protein
MKRFLVISLLICVGLVIGNWIKTTEVAAAEQIKLNFVSDYPERHPGVVGAFKPWIKEVEEKSGNRVKFTFFTPNALVPQKDGYDSTVSGMVDVLTGFPPNTPGKFPLCSVTELPFVATGSVATARVIWELNKKYPEWRKQFEETKLLWHWSGDISQLHTTKKLVKTVNDIKGMKIIGITPSAIERIKLLGGNPVEMSIMDIFMALERGMADGVILPFAAVRSIKVSDVAKYHTILNMDTAAFYAVMNKNKFNGLPTDIQKIFEETTGEKMGMMTSKAIQETSAADRQWMKDNGHTIYELPETERAKMAAILKPINEKWVKDMEAKGYKNARQIMDDTLRWGKEFSKQ